MDHRGDRPFLIGGGQQREDYYNDVLLPVESIMAGTWSGDDMPAEFADYQIMRGMGWSWEELESTPAYVRKYCADFLGLQNEVDERQRERDQHRTGG